MNTKLFRNAYFKLPIILGNYKVNNQYTFSLWSIQDYKDHFLHNKLAFEELYSQLLSNIASDPTNTFISSIKNIPSIPKDFSEPLAGIPIAIKDNICYSGFPTTCASKMLENWIAPYDATIITQILQKKGIIIGKTNLDEFAMGNDTSSSFFGKSFNPWDHFKRFSPGGSSGGSAISVALGYSPVSIGSDTGGSIRCPASFNGVLGLKPTYGRVSRYGLISYAHTLDQIGVFGRYVADMALMLEIISQPDEHDLTYKNIPFKQTTLELDKTLNVGVAFNSFNSVPADQKESLLHVLTLLEQKGYITLVPITLDDLDILLPTYYVTAFSEAYSNLVRYSGQQYGFDAGNIFTTRFQGFSEEVKRRFNLGSFSLKTGYDEQLYTKSQKIRSYYVDKFVQLFKSVQVIALPTMLDAAFTWDEFQSPIDSYEADLLTVPANLVGIPALSVPAGFTRKQDVKLPIGLQLMSSWWHEQELLQIAHAIQNLTDFHLQLPADLPVKS